MPIRLLTGFCLFVFLLSCNDFKHLSPRGKFILKSKKDTFRGLDFDATLQTVRQTEDTQPAREYPDYLNYKLLADSIATGESLELEYFFNGNNQLDLIIAFYTLSDKEAIHPLADEIRRYLERVYGRCKQDELGWYHWQLDDKTGEKGAIEINLVGETEEGYMGVELEMSKYYENEERIR